MSTQFSSVMLNCRASAVSSRSCDEPKPFQLLCGASTNPKWYSRVCSATTVSPRIFCSVSNSRSRGARSSVNSPVARWSRWRNESFSLRPASRSRRYSAPCVLLRLSRRSGESPRTAPGSTRRQESATQSAPRSECSGCSMRSSSLSMGGSSSAASRIRLASTSRLEKASRLSCTVRRPCHEYRQQSYISPADGKMIGGHQPRRADDKQRHHGQQYLECPVHQPRVRSAIAIQQQQIPQALARPSQLPGAKVGGPALLVEVREHHEQRPGYKGR